MNIGVPENILTFREPLLRVECDKCKRSALLRIGYSTYATHFKYD